MQAIFFFISLGDASGQGYSNCMLCCPAIQSPIIIWLSFVAFISGGSVGVAIAECQVGSQKIKKKIRKSSGITKGSAMCTHLLGGCLRGVVVKISVGFLIDRWRVFSLFAPFFFNRH